MFDTPPPSTIASGSKTLMTTRARGRDGARRSQTRLARASSPAAAAATMPGGVEPRPCEP